MMIRRWMVLLLVLGFTPRLAAQQPDRVRVDVRSGSYSFAPQDSRARLGVFLEAGCVIEPDVRGDCEGSPRVRAVVEGSPADLAGLRAGDVLLELDGVNARTEPGRRALARLRVGVPVQLEIRRGSAHRTVRAIPTARDDSFVHFRAAGGNVTSVRPAPRGSVSVFKFRDDSGQVHEVQFAPQPEGTPTRNGFVMFGPDEGGNLRVRVGRPDSEAFIVEGETLELTELEGFLTRLGDRLVELGEVEVDVAVNPARADMRRQLVLEDPALARRLEAARSEALRDARVQLGLLLESRNELLRADRGVFALRQAAPRADVELHSLDVRLGGAEFRALTPELAEYFDADRGLLVLRVISGTPAATLGLRGGDVVFEVGGETGPEEQMAARLARALSEADIEVKWIRKGTVLAGYLPGR